MSETTTKEKLALAEKEYDKIKKTENDLYEKKMAVEDKIAKLKQNLAEETYKKDILISFAKRFLEDEGLYDEYFNKFRYEYSNYPLEEREEAALGYYFTFLWDENAFIFRGMSKKTNRFKSFKVSIEDFEE